MAPAEIGFTLAMIDRDALAQQQSADPRHPGGGPAAVRRAKRRLSFDLHDADALRRLSLAAVTALEHFELLRSQKRQ